MRRYGGLLTAPALMALALTGCAGFDDYYAHDGWMMEGYPSASPCGCPTAPHSPHTLPPHTLPPHTLPQTPPPPLAGGPTVTPVSGSAMAPQTREPELLR